MIHIAAIILAAGKGARIGQPKLFLKTGSETFLERIIRELETAGLDEITVVVSPGLKREANALVKKHRLVVNPHPENGMVSSLHAGIQAAPGFDGYMAVPVDHPYVTSDTYSKLLMAFHGNSHRVIKPRYQGKPGHPVILPSGFAAGIPAHDVDGGLAGLLRKVEAEAVSVDVADEGVRQNINTKQDMQH